MEDESRIKIRDASIGLIDTLERLNFDIEESILTLITSTSMILRELGAEQDEVHAIVSVTAMITKGAIKRGMENV